MTENKQKAKLLLLMEILQQGSDEENPLTTKQLIGRLKDKDITCDRRTLSNDIADLNSLGYEVMSVMCGHEKGYYVDDRSFSVPELRILIDAVQAAGFIPNKKSKELMKKISVLGGTHRAKLLKDNTILFNNRKQNNDYIYYTISILEDSLSAKRKVSFLYFDLDEKHNKTYRKNGSRYIVEPIGLVLDRDRYYLTAVSPDREGISIYRIDHIDLMSMEDEPVSSSTSISKKAITTLTNQAFKMYTGTPKTVVLKFKKELINSVFDHFGKRTVIKKYSDSYYTAKVAVQISPTFFGWLFQFGNKMQLISPEEVVAEIHNYIKQLPY